MENQKESIGQYLYRRVTLKIGKLLCEERKARGLTVVQVAKLLGLRSKFIRNAEFGGIQMNWLTAGILLQFYQKQLTVSLIDEEDNLQR